MDRRLFIDAAALERQPYLFEAAIRPSLLDLAEGWAAAGPAEVHGKAELLDSEGLRTIRIRGRLRVGVSHTCDRCLRDLKRDFDDSFQLYFYPMDTIEQGGEVAIGIDETEIGFYEDGGVHLVDVVGEQLLLWLPARSLCDLDCKGICQVCGSNRNIAACDCRETFADPRWEGLRHLSYKH